MTADAADSLFWVKVLHSESESSLFHMVIRSFPVQTQLGASSGFGIQPRYKAPSDLSVET